VHPSTTIATPITYLYCLYMQLGRLRPHEDACSVLVRLIDSSRQGQLSTPATAARDSRAYRLPGYLAALGPKVWVMLVSTAVHGSGLTCMCLGMTCMS
jgi:hypothetical protein